MVATVSADNGSVSGSAGIKLSSDSSGVLALQTGANSTAMTLDASGNVGIGTTSPASDTANERILQVNAPTTFATVSISTSRANASGDNIGKVSFDVLNNTATYRSRAQIVAQSTGSTANKYGANMLFYTASDNTTDATERMRIDSSGNLLVGTTTASAKNYTVQTANAIALGAENQVGSFTSTVLRTGAYGTAAGTGFRHIECLGSSAQTVFQVLGNGNAQNANNSYGAVSDVKLKENIVDASPKLADLMQVQVRNYNLIGDTTKQIGVVAQELWAVFPAMVDETTDRDKEGNDLGTTTKAVKYSVFVPILIKAIQELKAINDTQAETINALTARIVALEGA